MHIKDTIKNPKIIIWLIFIIISLVLIAPNPNPNGMKILSIKSGSPVNSLSVGDIIYEINSEKATQSVINNDYFGILELQSNKGRKFITANGSLGMYTETVQPTNLKFGLDLKGGIRALIEPEVNTPEIADQVLNTLETRINIYGLRESVFRKVAYEDKTFVEITIAGGTEDELKTLLESQGKFEAKIPFAIKLSNGKGTLKVDKQYNVLVENKSIYIDDNKIENNFTLAGINFFVDGVNSRQINITSLALTGNDIKIVFFDPQRSRIETVGDSHRWVFSVQVSNEGAQKFFWIVQNIPASRISSGESYLDSQISFYLDGKLIDSLNIGASLKDNIATEISISGSADTFQEAVNTRNQLQSILRSGSLPTKIKIVQLDSVSPTLGFGFIKSALIAAFAAIIGVMAVIFIRYKKIKIVLPLMAISITEVMIVVGIYSGIGSTIDLSSIAGIIAYVGMGINDQIIIIDQAIKGEAVSESIKQKIKNAFFVVFGAAGTIIAAMLPLMFLGFGLLRGFAITTIIGVLIGVLITRPAFAVLVEKILER